MSTRWYIEAPDGEMFDVGADSLEIHASGALVFTIGREQVAYAAHAWSTFTSEVCD